MLMGFQQCMEALRVRRTRALPDARTLTLRLMHRAARVEEEADEPPPKARASAETLSPQPYIAYTAPERA